MPDSASLRPQYRTVQGAPGGNAAPQHGALGNSVQNVNMPRRPRHDSALSLEGESVEHADSNTVFAPQNFFDEAQDGDLRNRRRIVPAPDSK
ncbi:hypothetical protein DL768_007285 [Monosporascus sp. mg162]|nr:hypothetical protein DL768_007285 [Monosporascus sp. mg162]